MTIATLTARVMAKTGPFHANMRKVDAQLERSRMKMAQASSGSKAMGKSLASSAAMATGPMLALAAAAGAVMAIFKSTKTFAEYEQKMANVRAVTQATDSQMEQLSAKAKQLGETTQFSARQAAEGMEFLGMAGFSVNQIIGAMPSVLNLAAAGTLELGRAADITSNILTGYGLSISDLSRANDMLVSTFTGSNVTLEMLGESFKMVGPIASGLGINFDEVSAAIGLLGNAGIQGSLAGTSLRFALSSLVAPSDSVAEKMAEFGLNSEVANGKVSSLVNVLKKLEKGGANTADVLQLFGVRAGPAMAKLLQQGSGSLEEMIKRLRESEGLAGRIAEDKLNTLNGAWTIFKSKMEGVGITIGSVFAPALKGIIWMLGSLADGFLNNQDAIKLWGTFGVSMIATAVGKMIEAFFLLRTVAYQVKSAFWDVLKSIAERVAMFADFMSEQLGKGVMGKLFGFVKKGGDSAVKAFEQMSRGAELNANKNQQSAEKVRDALAKITTELATVGTSNVKVGEAYDERSKKIDDLIAKLTKQGKVEKKVAKEVWTAWSQSAVDAAKERVVEGFSDQLGSAINNAVEGAKLGAAAGGIGGGIQGMIVGLVASSETLSTAFDMVNGFAQQVADKLGALLKPLLPLLGIILKVVGSGLDLVINLVAKAFGLLTPILKFFFKAIRGVGIAILKVAKWIADRFGGSSKIDKALKEMKKTTWDNVNATEAQTEATRAATAEIWNMVEGFKLALARFNSAQGVQVPPGASLGVGPSGGRPSGFVIDNAAPQAGGNIGVSQQGVTLNVKIVSNDAVRIWEQIKDLMESENVGRYGLPTLRQAAPFSSE